MFVGAFCVISGWSAPLAYVANLQGNNISVVDTSSNSVTGSISARLGPTGVALSPDNAYLYATLQTSGQLAIISTASNSVVNTLTVGSSPVAVAVTPNGAYAYVVNQGSNSVSVVSMASQSVVNTIGVGSKPMWIAISPNGARAVVTNLLSQSLSVIDIGSNSVIANYSINVGGAGAAVSNNGQLIYVANEYDNVVNVMDLNSGALITSIPVQSYPSALALSSNGTRLYVVNSNSKTVSVVDTASNSVLANIGVGLLPTAIALTPDGSRAYVTNALGYSTSVIDTASYSVVTTLNLIGVYPSGVAISNGPAAPQGCNVSLSPGRTSFASIGGSGSVGVSSGCTWPVSSDANWLTVTSGGSGSGSGVVNFSVANNQSYSPRSATLTIGMQSLTISQAAALCLGASCAAPTADSISPSSGVGGNQTFSLSFSDINSVADLNIVYLLINGGLDGANACFAAYSRYDNLLYVVNDGGNGLVGAGLVPGSNGSLSSSQCTLSAGASSAAASGNTLTLNLALTFSANFAGARNIFIMAVDLEGMSSGWVWKGNWITTQNQPPSMPSIAPSSGGGGSQTFTLTYSDANGYKDLAVVYALFNSALDGANACFIAYNRPMNMLYLINNTGNGLVGAIPAGSGQSFSNQRCTVVASGAATGSSNTLTLPVTVYFQSGIFSGLKNSYLLAYDGSLTSSGWQQGGTWLVP